MKYADELEAAGIRVVADGIGNEAYECNVNGEWIELGYYIDMPDERIWIAYHWWFNKRKGVIEPIYHMHGRFCNYSYEDKHCYWSDVKHTCNLSWDSENVERELVDLLKVSAGLLRKRFQVLKGKRTMRRKWEQKHYDDFDAISTLLGYAELDKAVHSSIELCNGRCAYVLAKRDSVTKSVFHSKPTVCTTFILEFPDSKMEIDFAEIPGSGRYLCLGSKTFYNTDVKCQNLSPEMSYIYDVSEKTSEK